MACKQGAAHIPALEGRLIEANRYAINGAINAAEQGQHGDLCQQREHQGHRAEGTDARIFHDFQGAMPVIAAAQAVCHIGQPVFMKAARHEHGRHG